MLMIILTIGLGLISISGQYLPAGQSVLLPTPFRTGGGSGAGELGFMSRALRKSESRLPKVQWGSAAGSV